MVGYLFKPIEKRQSIYSHTQAKKQQQWERKVRVLLHLWNIVWFMFTLPPKYGNQQYILYVIDKTRSKIQSKSNWSNRVLRYSTVFFFHHNMWMPIDIAATHTPLLNIWEEIFFFPIPLNRIEFMCWKNKYISNRILYTLGKIEEQLAYRLYV